MDQFKRAIALEGWTKNCTFARAYERMLQLNDKFLLHKAYYEQVGAQKAIDDIHDIRKKEAYCPFCSTPERQVKHKPLRLEGVRPPGGDSTATKEDRIRFYLQSVMEEGRYYIRKGMFKLLKQIREFPHGDLVDLLDADAYATNKLRRPLTDEEREREEEAKKRREQPMPAGSRVYSERSYGGYA